MEKSCFFDDYPMIQSGQAKNVNLHAYRFGSYFFRKYKYPLNINIVENKKTYIIKNIYYKLEHLLTL